MKYMLYQGDDALPEAAEIRDYHAFFAKNAEYTTNTTGIPEGVLQECVVHMALEQFLSPHLTSWVKMIFSSRLPSFFC